MTIALAAVAPVAGRALAAQGVTVSRTDTASVPVDSTGRATLVFRLDNRAPAARLARIALTLPPGWRTVAPDTLVTIGPRDSELAFIPIWVPPDAKAGTAAVAVVVSANGVDARDSALVTVPARHRLIVVAAPPPRFVAAGESYTLVFRVRNEGNAPIPVELRASGSNGIGARIIDSTEFRLAPGAERLVRAEVETSARLTTEVRHRVVMNATGEGPSRVAVAATTLVEIVPRRVGASSRFRSLPAELTLRGGDQSNSYTAELRGGGRLGGSMAGARLDFQVRGPNPTGSFLSQQDVFRAGIRSRHARLDLGDQLTYGSILTETGRATFGITGGLDVGRVEMEAYSRRDRRLYAVTGEQQHGGSATMWMSRYLRIGGGAFTRDGVDRADGVTAHAGVTGFRGMTVDGAVARTRSPAGDGLGYTAALTGLYPRFSYDLRRESADEGLANYWRATSTTNASSFLRPLGALVISARASETRGARVSFLPFSADRSNASGEVGVSWGRIAGVTARAGHETGLTFAPGPDRDSRSAAVFAGVPWRRAFLRVDAEQGYSAYATAPDDRVPFSRIGASTTLAARDHQLSASVQRLTGTAPFTVSSQDRVSGNASASLRIGSYARLNVDVSTMHYWRPVPTRYTTIDVGLGRQFSQGRRVVLRSRALAYSPAIATRRSMQNLEIAMPVGIPVGLSPDNASLDVEVRDEVTGKAAPDVLLRFGNEARITNAAGLARFTGLSEGEFFLEVDRGTLAPGRIVMPATPMGIALRSGEKRRVALTVMGGVRLDGRVRMQEWRRPRIDGPDTLADAGAATGVVIGMANGDTVRVPTDVEGRFSFTDLHPGKWTLFIVAANVPPAHRFDRERVPLDLVPGAGQRVDLNIVPDRPQVRFQPTVEIAPVVVMADTPRPEPSAGAPRHSYTVASARETLMQIAGIMYGDRALWPKIWLANARLLPTPESVRIGQRLVVPDSAALTAEEIAARDRYLAGRGAPVVSRSYTVNRGATLMFIARVVYNDESLWPKIWYANLDQLPDPTRLRPGMRLRIPEKRPLTAAEIALRDSYRRKPGG